MQQNYYVQSPQQYPPMQNNSRIGIQNQPVNIFTRPQDSGLALPSRFMSQDKVPLMNSLTQLYESSTQIPTYLQPQLQTKEKIQQVQEVHHFERPIQVVTIEDMESKWKHKCIQLEQTVYDLQLQLQKLKNTQQSSEPLYIKDDSKTRELEQRVRGLIDSENNLRRENQNLKDEIFNWKGRYSELEHLYASSQGNDEVIRQLKLEQRQFNLELENLKRDSKVKDEDLQKLRNFLAEKTDENNALQEQIYELQQRLESQQQSESTITYLKSEVDLWKKKFRELNTELHQLQEDHMLAQAEMDSMKNRKIQVSNPMTERTFTNAPRIPSNLPTQGQPNLNQSNYAPTVQSTILNQGSPVQPIYSQSPYLSDAQYGRSPQLNINDPQTLFGKSQIEQLTGTESRQSNYRPNDSQNMTQQQQMAQLTGVNDGRQSNFRPIESRGTSEYERQSQLLRQVNTDQNQSGRPTESLYRTQQQR